MSTITQLICRNFGGIRQKNAVFSEEMISAKDIQNVELYFTGINNGIGIRTTKGNNSVNDELVETGMRVVAIFQSVQKGQKFFFVYAEGGEEGEEEGILYNCDLLTMQLSVLKDGLTVTGNAQGLDVIQGWSDLFFFTNGEEMFTVEMGITTTNTIVDMTPKDRDDRDVRGLGCAVYANRLFIFNGNILWYSVTSNIYDFATADLEWTTSAGYIELLKDLTAIHPYLDSLALFYRDSSALLSVKDGIFAISEESPAGCAGINSLVFHDTNLYFYDDIKKSVFSFKQVISGQKTLGENIAVDIQDILQDIDATKLNEIRALSVFIENRNEIWWIIPTDETYEHKAIVNDEEVITQEPASIILIYDYLKGEWVKRKSQKINTICIINDRLYSGAEDGNLLEEYATDTFNGQYIQHYYNCSAWNLGAMNTLKVLVLPPRVSFDFPYTNQFYVKYVKNYNNFKKPKIKYIKSKIKNYLYWDIGHWDVNFWLNRHTNAIGKFPNATFKVIEISLYTTNIAENFAIRNIEFSKIKVKQI